MNRYGAVLFSSAVLSLGWAPLATAADMRVKAPVYKPAAAAVYDWTGCYVGGNIGSGWQKTTSTDAEPGGGTFLEDAGTNTGTGVVGGGQIGCDYQFAPKWVLGIQGMFDGAGVNGSHVAPFSYAADNTEYFEQGQTGSRRLRRASDTQFRRKPCCISKAAWLGRRAIFGRGSERDSLGALFGTGRWHPDRLDDRRRRRILVAAELVRVHRI